MPDVEGVLIVDGANWSRALEGGRWRIDYERVVSRLQQVTGVKIVGLSYFTAYRTKTDLDRRWPFLNYLKDLGWQVQVMPATQGVDGIWRDKEVDIAIALEAYEEVVAGRVGAILIGSGDEDFGALYRRLPENVGRWVVGFRKTVSSHLREVADIIFLDDLGVIREGRERLSGLDDGGYWYG